MIFWIAILVVYGLCFGFGEVRALDWWLLIPFFYFENRPKGPKGDRGETGRVAVVHRPGA